jgi:hypothetical protein
MVAAAFLLVMFAGTDFNGNPMGFPMLIQCARESFVQAVTVWAPVHLLALSLFAFAINLSGRSLRPWIIAASVSDLIFAYLVAMYVSQAVAYRTTAPLNMRYDFSRLLFEPVNCCLLACYCVYLIRQYLGRRAADVICLGTGAMLVWIFIPKFSEIQQAPPFAAIRNIQATTKFYNEMQAIVSAGKAAPQVPIIMEAHEPLSWAYEPLLSLSTYLWAFGASNTVSVRLHAEVDPTAPIAGGFKGRLIAMQSGDQTFAPLFQSLGAAAGACISVGINGSPPRPWTSGEEDRLREMMEAGSLVTCP